MWNCQSMPPYEASCAQLAVPPDDVAGTDRLISCIGAEGGTAKTDTVALSLLDESATLVATRWYVPGAPGAV
jgi:hypothetical protein